MSETVGIIKQFKGPFTNEESLSFNPELAVAKIGFSINEKDFMAFPTCKIKIIQTLYEGDNLQQEKKGIDQIIFGKTYIYEPGVKIYLQQLSFPEGAPASLLIDLIFCTDDEENQLITEGD